MYGPDADALYGAVEGVLKKSNVAKGGHATKRYGEAADMSAKEVEVRWG